jgi:large subunit ribosomal protein L35
MVKQKTRKAAAKRFSFSKAGKVMRRRTMHGHFNVGRSKKTLMARRRDQELDSTDRKRIARLMPFDVPAQQ